jgi:TonB family protein
MTGVVSHHPPQDGGRKLWLAVLLSVLVHTLGGVVATRLAVDAGGGDSKGFLASSRSSWAAPLQLDWAAPPEPESSERDKVRAEPLDVTPPMAIPLPQPEEMLRLGLEDSDQRTNNVLGFKDPTPHMAPEMGVDQPALDPNAGSQTAGGPVPQGVPEGREAPDQADATQMEQGPPRPPQTEEIAGPQGNGPKDLPAKPAETAGAEDAPKQPGEGPMPGKAEPSPAQPAVTQGEEIPEAGEGTDKANKPPESAGSPQPTTAPPPGTPEGQAPPSPQPPAANPGDTSNIDPVLGTMPGERSEKEADPSGKEKPIEIVLGRPAAGQGLEIITKRPKRNPFSLVTRVMSLPNNPSVEVKFGRDGRVKSAKITRSSGVSDVDDPVLAAVYTWTAKGKRLETLPTNDPNAAITVRVTILIR